MKYHIDDKACNPVIESTTERNQLSFQATILRNYSEFTLSSFKRKIMHLENQQVMNLWWIIISQAEIHQLGNLGYIQMELFF